MKTGCLVLALIGCFGLAGCANLNEGAPGVIQSGSATGTGLATPAPDVPTPSSPYFQAGSADQIIANSRARAATGDPQITPSEMPPATGLTDNANPGPGLPAPDRPDQPTANEIVLQRIQLALTSADPQMAPILDPYSIEALHNVHVTVNDGVVTLTGQVASFQQKDNIAARVRAVRGVSFVKNELEVVPPPVQTPGRVPSP